VVICKSSYPYMLAHRRGEALLARAKRLAKTSTPLRSTVDFDLILGADVGQVDDEGWTGGRRHLVASCRPYWVTDDGNYDAGLGLPLWTLIDQRRALNDLPGKRRAELRALFQQVPDGPDLSFVHGNWDPELQALLRRIRRSKEQYAAVKGALSALGEHGSDQDGNLGRWRRVDRMDERRYVHGLPDLLDMWHFAHKLGTSLDDYV